MEQPIIEQFHGTGRTRNTFGVFQWIVLEQFHRHLLGHLFGKIHRPKRLVFWVTEVSPTAEEPASKVKIDSNRGSKLGCIQQLNNDIQVIIQGTVIQ